MSRHQDELARVAGLLEEVDAAVVRRNRFRRQRCQINQAYDRLRTQICDDHHAWQQVLAIEELANRRAADVLEMAVLLAYREGLRVGRSG